MSLPNHINKIETSLQNFITCEERLSLEIHKLDIEKKNKISIIIADLKDINRDLTKELNDMKTWAETVKLEYKDNVETEIKNQNWSLYNSLFGSLKFNKSNKKH